MNINLYSQSYGSNSRSYAGGNGYMNRNAFGASSSGKGMAPTSMQGTTPQTDDSYISKRRELSRQLDGIHRTEKQSKVMVRLSKGMQEAMGLSDEPDEKGGFVSMNSFSVSAESMVNSLWGKSETSSEEDELLKKGTDYNFREVSSKIRQAKTSVSAGQAVLAARRKVLELKRKLVSAGDDSGDIEAALNHAKQMELVAKKKRRHLEIEEMVAANRKKDEQQDKMEEAASDMQSALAEIAGEKIDEELTEINEQQTEMMAEMAEELRTQNEEMTEEMSEEMLAALDEFVEKFGAEEKEMLEEMSEMLESMEAVDPHMSQEELEELKKKHRMAEEKQMMKADMEYLKEVFDKLSKEGAKMPGMGSVGSGMSGIAAAFSAPSGIAMPSISGAVSVPAPSMDIQV